MPELIVTSQRELVHLLIKAGSLWDVKVPAKQGQRLSCSFATQGHGDIAFTALFVPGVAVDSLKVYSQQPEVLDPESLCRSGSLIYQAHADGVVLLRFDNQHSWTRSKSIELSVESHAAQPRSPDNPAKSLTQRERMESKMDAWLSTIPIGMGGAEGANSQRSYDPKPMVEFGLREGHENESADDIYRLFVERQVQDAEEEMVAQGVLPVEPDAELLVFAEHCSSLDHASLCSARTRRHLERALIAAMEAHSTFLVYLHKHLPPQLDLQGYF